MSEDSNKDPNLSKKPEDKSAATEAASAESVLPPDIFYGQMLIFDMFANNLNLFGALDTSRKVESENVYKLLSKEIDKINDLAKIRKDKTQGFIEKITPLEIAQLLPKIELSIYDAAKDKQTNLQLVNPTDLNSYASGGYFEGGVVGLKSISMLFDGTSAVAFAKHYIVDMTFVFDSINTFTAPVPGMGGLTYADIFKTQGRAVSSSNKFFRLTISHSGMKEIVEKYGLNDDSFSTTLNLTPMTCKLAIKEDLTTEIQMKLTSLEEKVLEDRNLFDFLKLNLENSKKEKEKAFKEAKEGLEKAIEEKNEAKAAALEERASNPAIQVGKMSITFQKNKLKALRDKYDGKTSDQADYSYLDFLEEMNLEGEIADAEKAEQEAKEEITKEYDEEIEKDTEEYEDKKKAAEDRFANHRAQAIGKRLNEVIFSPGNASGAIKEVKMSVEQIKNYFNDRAAFEKDLMEQAIAAQAAMMVGFFGGGDGKGKEGKDGEKPDESKKDETKPTGEEDSGDKATREAELKAKKADLKLEIEAQNAGIAAMKALGVEPAPDGEVAKEIKRLKEQLAEVDKQITELNSTIKTEEGEIGKEGDLIKKYSDFNVVKYITFGDLMSLIMNALVSDAEKTADSSALKQTASLKQMLAKSRLLTCKVNTPSAAGPRVKEMYDLPIAIAELELIFSKRLFGKSENTLTIFDVISDIVQVMNNTKQTILSTFPSKLSKDYSKFGSYAMKIRTYSLIGDGPYEIMKKHKNKNYRMGFVLDIAREGDGLGAEVAESEYKPVFYFGGPATGAQIKAEISEISDSKLEKAAFSKQKSTDAKYQPAFYKNTMTLFATPIFHLGMLYTLKAPTIKTSRASSWLFIEGDYSVTKVVHNYQAGGTYTTKVEGFLNGSSNAPDAEKEASEPVPAEKAAEVEPAKDAAKQAAVDPSTPKIDSSNAGWWSKAASAAKSKE